jgi:hypothetical protein
VNNKPNKRHKRLSDGFVGLAEELSKFTKSSTKIEAVKIEAQKEIALKTMENQLAMAGMLVVFMCGSGNGNGGGGGGGGSDGNGNTFHFAHSICAFPVSFQFAHSIFTFHFTNFIWHFQLTFQMHSICTFKFQFQFALQNIITHKMDANSCRMSLQP